MHIHIHFRTHTHVSPDVDLGQTDSKTPLNTHINLHIDKLSGKAVSAIAGPAREFHQLRRAAWLGSGFRLLI